MVNSLKGAIFYRFQKSLLWLCISDRKRAIVNPFSKSYIAFVFQTEKKQFFTPFSKIITLALSFSQEKEKLQEKNITLEQKLSSHLEMADAKVGSISIMKQSLDQIKERLEKKEKQCKRMEKTLSQREVGCPFNF